MQVSLVSVFGVFLGFFLLDIYQFNNDMVWSNFVILQKCQNAFPQEKKTMLKLVLVFSIWVLLTYLDGQHREPNEGGSGNNS